MRGLIHVARSLTLLGLLWGGAVLFLSAFS